MRILVVSHTYIVPLNREKLRLLSYLEPDLEVIIVVPQTWQPGGVQNRQVTTEFYQENNFRVIPIANWSQNNQGLLTFGWPIVALLQSFKPDIIQVEQGVKSLAYAQLITLNQFLKLGAKNILFTWWNIPYQLKFPLAWLESYNLHHTDGLIGGNQDAVNILRSHGYQQKAMVMPQLGVDETLFYAQDQSVLRQSLGLNKEDFVIGYIGRFVREKGLLTLLKSLAALTSLTWKLLLVGRGEFKTVLQQAANQQGISDRLIWVENVAHDQVVDYVNVMQVLVLPSETSHAQTSLTAKGWKEQFGHVLIEAMACKIPVIGSDSGEIPNVIGEAGLIFPEGQSHELTICLKKIIEQVHWRDILAQKGYERVVKEYTNQALAQKLLNFYKNILIENMVEK